VLQDDRNVDAPIKSTAPINTVEMFFRMTFSFSYERQRTRTTIVPEAIPDKIARMDTPRALLEPVVATNCD
jgi:hypothetical protein